MHGTHIPCAYDANIHTVNLDIIDEPDSLLFY